MKRGTTNYDTAQPGSIAMHDPAALAVHRPICDPGELCGEVQIDLNNAGLRHEFDRAAQLATQAVLAEKLSGSANTQ